MDGPFNEVADEAEQYIKVGATVYFKFTCEHCSSRQTFTERNTLYETGKCEECGHITSLVSCGCGFMLLKEL